MKKYVIRNQAKDEWNAVYVNKVNFYNEKNVTYCEPKFTLHLCDSLKMKKEIAENLCNIINVVFNKDYIVVEYDKKNLGFQRG